MNWMGSAKKRLQQRTESVGSKQRSFFGKRKQQNNVIMAQRASSIDSKQRDGDSNEFCFQPIYANTGPVGREPAPCTEQPARYQLSSLENFEEGYAPIRRTHLRQSAHSLDVQNICRPFPGRTKLETVQKSFRNSAGAGSPAIPSRISEGSERSHSPEEDYPMQPESEDRTVYGRQRQRTSFDYRLDSVIVNSRQNMIPGNDFMMEEATFSGRESHTNPENFANDQATISSLNALVAQQQIKIASLERELQEVKNSDFRPVPRIPQIMPEFSKGPGSYNGDKGSDNRFSCAESEILNNTAMSLGTQQARTTFKRPRADESYNSEQGSENHSVTINICTNSLAYNAGSGAIVMNPQPDRLQHEADMVHANFELPRNDPHQKIIGAEDAMSNAAWKNGFQMSCESGYNGYNVANAGIRYKNIAVHRHFPPATATNWRPRVDNLDDPRMILSLMPPSGPRVEEM